MKVEKATAPRTDRSATARLVQDFGLLLLKGDFERYLDERSSFNQAAKEGKLDEYVSLEELHPLKFVPMLQLLGIEDLGNDPQSRYPAEIERLQLIEAFVKALQLTVDFTLKVSELHKRLQRKFKDKPDVLRLPYRTKRLVDEDLVRHCRDVMWIIEEFHVEADCDQIDTALWDVNIWTIILDADKLHREQGYVHSAFYRRLSAYQSTRGDGSPRVYIRTALTVLLAECFEDFGRNNRKPQIHDKSEPSDTDPYGRRVENRVSEYDSAFADFLIAFIDVTSVRPPVRKDNNSLDHYRKILRLRKTKQIPYLSSDLGTSLKAPCISRILDALDQLKV